MTLDKPKLSLSPPPYRYQPTEQTYTDVGDGNAWEVRRSHAASAVVVVNAPDDTVLEHWNHQVTFVFDTAGNIADAYGYRDHARSKNWHQRQVKFPLKKKAHAAYINTAGLMRQRLLNEPVRDDVPVLAKYSSPSDATRLLLLTRADEGDFEIANINIDAPTDCIIWHGPDPAHVIEQALPSRTDFVWEFYDEAVLHAYDKAVLEPQRRQQRRAEITAQAVANVAALPQTQLALLRRLKDQDSIVLDEADIETARQLEENGWGAVFSHSGYYGTALQRFGASEAGKKVLEALATYDTREHLHNPFHHENFQSGGDGLTEQARQAFAPRPVVPLVVQKSPLFGGTLDDFFAWHKTLSHKRQLIAGAWRGVIMALAENRGMDKTLKEQIQPFLKQVWSEYWANYLTATHRITAKAFQNPESRKGITNVDSLFHALLWVWDAVAGEEADALPAEQAVHFVAESWKELHRNAIWGLEERLSGEAHLLIPPLRRWHKIKIFTGGMFITKPTEHQRAALEWPYHARRNFGRWLADMARQPEADTPETLDAFLQRLLEWSDWKTRNESVGRVLDALEKAGVQVEGEPFDLRAWFAEQDWRLTVETVLETEDATRKNLIATGREKYRAKPKPEDAEHTEPADDAQLHLFSAERSVYEQMAGQAIGQTLGIEDALYWTRFQMPTMNGNVENDSPCGGPELAGPIVITLPVNVQDDTDEPPAETVAPEKAATPYTLRCNGFGILEFKNGGAPVTVSWLGSDDLDGPAEVIEQIRQLFGAKLQRQKSSRAWTLTATA